jgi:hypothetical protein
MDDFPDYAAPHEYISITRLELTEDLTIPNWLWSRRDPNRNRWSVDVLMLVRCTADPRACRRFMAPNFPRMRDSTGLYCILLIANIGEEKMRTWEETQNLEY